MIDISGGKNGANYPARYVRSALPDVQQFNKYCYKTQRLALRRITKETGSSTLTNDYFFGVFPVTQYQYNLVAGSNPSTFKTDAEGNPAALRPVETLNQQTAQSSFLNVLTARVTVRGAAVTAFAHTTAEQWVRAYRAGTTTTYYWGSDVTKALNYAWYSDNSGGTTHAVGDKLPNAWGLFGMAGNVSDWTSSTCPSSWYYCGGNYAEARSETCYSKKASWPNWLNKNSIGFRAFQELFEDDGHVPETSTPSVTASATRANLSLDLRAAPARVVATLGELFPVALNSTTNWVAGGDAEATSFARVSAMSGSDPADPTTWTAYKTTDRAALAGEGTDAWKPTLQGLYRVERVIGETVCGTGYLDMRDTEGLDARISLKDAAVTLAGTELPYDAGNPVEMPVESVVLAGETLVAGEDYSVSYASNVLIGTAYVYVNGIGDYGGQAERTFRVVPNLGTDVSSAEMTVKLDVRLAPARKILTLSELFPIALNSATNWTKGGLDGKESGACVADMSGTDVADPTTWEAGKVYPYETYSGELVYSGWTPPRRGLYRVQRMLDGVAHGAGYFDMTETAELPDKPSIAGATVTAPSTGTWEASGAKLKGVTVVLDGVTLSEYLDYVITYASNTVFGTALAYITGTGEYGGQITRQFTVVPALGELISHDAGSGWADGSTQRVVRIHTMRDSHPFAWNTSESFATNVASEWVIGGLTGKAGGTGVTNIVASISLAPMASADAEADETRRFVALEASGEGARRLRSVAKGYYLARLSVLTNGYPKARTLDRVIHVQFKNGLMLSIR